jgi:hypothetical protein
MFIRVDAVHELPAEADVIIPRNTRDESGQRTNSAICGFSPPGQS